MEFLLKIFYDDYGYFDRAYFFVFFLIPVILYFVFNTKKPLYSKIPFVMLWLLTTNLWMFMMTSNKIYSYIPSHGTEAQKSTLARCTQGQTVAEESIKEVMKACRKAGTDGN